MSDCTVKSEPLKANTIVISRESWDYLQTIPHHLQFPDYSLWSDKFLLPPQVKDI